MNKEILVFTDGASRGNPGPGGWGSVIVDGGNVMELGGREDNTTNNRMEMAATLNALKNIKSDRKIVIFTDSSYVANGISSWIFNWKTNDWKTKTKKDVLNKDLWQEIDKSMEGKDIEMKVVEGHVGVPGNERCDYIATAFADKEKITLFKGSRDEYSIDILSFDKNKISEGKKDRSKMKAYSYLSLVDGDLKKHRTWAECEKRVKGKKNVKFRKAVSKEDEEEIMKEWGVNI